MSTTRTRIARAFVLCALLALAAPLAAQASTHSTAAIPCWKRLLNDWYDGTINNVYPIACYQQAINHLPADLRIYGSARDDILAARQAALQHKSAPAEKGHPVGSTSTTTPTTTTTKTSKTTPTSTTSTTTTTTQAVTTNGTTTTRTTVLVVPVATTPPKKSGGIGGALDKLNPGNPDSFPLPLLILGALAILLVIAGAGGMLWQRRHPRDDSAEA